MKHFLPAAGVGSARTALTPGKRGRKFGLFRRRRGRSSLIGGSGGATLYKIFAIAQRDNIKLNMAWSPKEFDVEAKENFDLKYMRELYNLEYEYGRSGENWYLIPPDFLTVE